MNVLEKLQKNIDEVSGTKYYNLKDIMTNEFIQKNTTFNTYDDMINKSGLELTETSVEELYLNEGLNAFIKSNTKFEDFGEMCRLAVVDYTVNRVVDL